MQATLSLVICRIRNKMSYINLHPVMGLCCVLNTAPKVAQGTKL